MGFIFIWALVLILKPQELIPSLTSFSLNLISLSLSTLKQILLNLFFGLACDVSGLNPLLRCSKGLITILSS